jgi:hypothetical protein
MQLIHLFANKLDKAQVEKILPCLSADNRESKTSLSPLSYCALQEQRHIDLSYNSRSEFSVNCDLNQDCVFFAFTSLLVVSSYRPLGAIVLY